jgi:PAS domain S-box-containing protein
MASLTVDRGGSIRLRAAVLTSALLALALVAVIAYTFIAIRISLVRAGEARATAAATQIAGVIAAPLPARLVEVEKLVVDDNVRALLANPSPELEQAVMARLGPILAKAVQHQSMELWTLAGQRVFLLQVPASGSSVPPATAAPTAVGILPYVLVNDVVLSEVVVEVRATGPNSPVVGRLLSRRVATNPNTPDTLSRLIGSGGRVLVGNQAGPVWTDFSKAVDAPPIDARTAGVHQYRGADGDAKIAAVAPMTGIPLAIVVEFPMSLVVAPAWALLRQLSLVGLVFTLIAVAVVWKLSARVSQPLNQLADALRGVSDGDFSRRIVTASHTEVGRLGDAFNSMAAKIQAGLEELEAQARQLKENDNRKAAMMNAALDSIITTDADGRITDCNPAAERVFGFDHAAILQQNLGQLLTLTDFQPVLGRKIEVRANRNGGGVFPAELSLIAIRSDGTPGYAAFVRDLTEQKAGEDSLRRSIMLEEENRRVQEASRLKSEFLANMSHELRTPLNAIIGFAELLYDGQVTPDMPQFKEFMHDIVTSGQHLLQLINDVLDLSKVEAGRLEFHPEDSDLQQVVGESIGILRTLAAQKQLTITQDVEAAAAVAFVDRARLKQVLYNYLSNAIKFTPERGRVGVRVQAEGGQHFRIEVSDTGIGISPEDQQKLFVEFNQLEAGAAKKHQGTGLGLALTKRLIEAQGGSVGVRSSVGEGSTFYAVLPLRATRGTPVAGPRSIPAQRLGAPWVLVIEDTAADQEAIVLTLVSAGFNVETATTRAQALVKLGARTFDAITLDLLLPDATGADILQDLRANDRNRHVPVVIITVIARGGAIAGFAVSDILSKPVDGGVLLQALERAGVNQSSRGHVLVVDDDPGSLRLMAASLNQLGYTSVCVERAIEGLRLCEINAPLAVVLDLQMPDMDGFGFLEHFRMLPSCKHTPVIVWTVKDLSRDDYERLRSSVQGVMGKGQSGTASVVEELRRFTTQKQA